MLQADMWQHRPGKDIICQLPVRRGFFIIRGLKDLRMTRMALGSRDAFMNSAPTLLDMSPDDIGSLVESLGEKPFRAKQLLEWIYRKGETRFEYMTSLSRELRDALAGEIRVGGEVEEVVRTDDGKTAKYLFVYDDGSHVEAVSMHEKNRHTVCLSSQVGCAMGCAFCATAGMGFTRNLTAGEMLLQFLTIQREEGHVNNAVFMGMGEPLLNVSSVVKAIEALTDPKRIGLGTRRITISTCGIVPGILALATAPKRVRLALSLNSPFDDQRAELMPIDRKYPLLDVIAACESYAKTAGQRVTVEYVLLGGVNTGPGAAKALAAAYDGDQDLAFFADPTYWECVNDDRDAAAEPRQMDRVFDLENPDATDPDCWFYPDFWPEINVGKVWCVQLDLVRWAVETDFSGSRSAMTSSSSRGWTLR